MVIEAIDNLIQDLKEFSQVVPELMAEAMEELAPVIRKMNEEQLDKGLRSDDSQLPDYSPVSVAKFGKRPGPMNLKKTGSFRNKITVKANPTFAEIISTDSKTGMLEAKFELTIVGIPDSRLDEFRRDHLLPLLQRKIYDYYARK